MEHEDAVKSHAVEKYLLGEMTDADRDAFEDHYFECLTCADDVQNGLAFVDNAAAAMRSAPETVTAAKTEKTRASWRDWFSFNLFQPAFAVPMAALIAIAVLWPLDHARLHRQFSEATAPQLVDRVTVDVARGKPISVARSGRFFTVSFFLDNDALSSYAIEIRSGPDAPATVVAPQLPGNRGYNVLLLVAAYPAGTYQLVVRGGPGTDAHIVETFDLQLQ